MSEASHQKRLTRALEALREIGDPLDRLDAVRQAREAVEELELQTVAEVRRAGATWSAVGQLYQLTKQGAHQRFRSIDRE